MAIPKNLEQPKISSRAIHQVIVEDCSFLLEMKKAKGLLLNIVKLGVLTETSIRDINGNVIKVTKKDYLSPSDLLVKAVSSYGLDSTLSYQLIKLFYHFKNLSVLEYISFTEEKNGEQQKITTYDCVFTVPSEEDLLRINYLARPYFKYERFSSTEETPFRLFSTPASYSNSVTVKNIRTLVRGEGSYYEGSFYFPNIFSKTPSTSNNELTLSIAQESDETIINGLKLKTSVLSMVYNFDSENNTVSLCFENVDQKQKNDEVLNRILSKLDEGEQGKAIGQMINDKPNFGGRRLTLQREKNEGIRSISYDEHEYRLSIKRAIGIEETRCHSANITE